MESQPQNPEFRNNPENFHPCSNNKPLDTFGRIFKWGRSVASLIIYIARQEI